MWTESSTDATVDANEWLSILLVPKDSTERARIHALTTANTMLGVEFYAAAFSLSQCLCWANARAGSLRTCAADDDNESLSHAASRTNTDARLANASEPASSSTGKHAKLAANTAIHIND